MKPNIVGMKPKIVFRNGRWWMTYQCYDGVYRVAANVDRNSVMYRLRMAYFWDLVRRPRRIK